jgi:hypothetical protein
LICTSEFVLGVPHMMNVPDVAEPVNDPDACHGTDVLDAGATPASVVMSVVPVFVTGPAEVCTPALELHMMAL